MPPEAAKSRGNTLKSAPVDDKGKSAMEVKDSKVTTSEKDLVEEGPLERKNTGARKYVVHHSTDKTMTVEQIAEGHTFAEKMGYPLGETIFGGWPDDYMYCC